jgi:hypothetical protein
MSTHDYDIANAAGATVRSDLNNVLGAIVTWNSNATAPATTFARMRWADTTSGTIKRRNAANSGWLIESTDDETRVVDRAANTILDESDIGKFFRATATFTQTLTAAATLSDGWHCFYRIESGATITFDPNAAETINGAATLAVVGPASLIIACNGAAFYAYSIEQPASDTVAGKIEIADQTEMEANSDVTKAVTPGRAHYHPGVAKCWGKAGITGNLISSYNVTSVTDTGTGIITVTIATDFSSADYAVLAEIAQGTVGTSYNHKVSGQVAGSFVIRCYVNADPADTAADPDNYFWACFGDHA